jgi:hypothetical protein
VTAAPSTHWYVLQCGSSTTQRAAGYVDGCAYAFTLRCYVHNGGFRFDDESFMPVETSKWESFEIDTPADLKVARMLEPRIAELIRGET